MASGAVRSNSKTVENLAEPSLFTVLLFSSFINPIEDEAMHTTAAAVASFNFIDDVVVRGWRGDRKLPCMAQPPGAGGIVGRLSPSSRPFRDGFGRQMRLPDFSFLSHNFS